MARHADTRNWVCAFVILSSNSWKASQYEKMELLSTREEKTPQWQIWIQRAGLKFRIEP